MSEWRSKMPHPQLKSFYSWLSRKDCLLKHTQGLSKEIVDHQLTDKV